MAFSSGMVGDCSPEEVRPSIRESSKLFIEPERDGVVTFP